MSQAQGIPPGFQVVDPGGGGRSGGGIPQGFVPVDRGKAQQEAANQRIERMREQGPDPSSEEYQKRRQQYVEQRVQEKIDELAEAERQRPDGADTRYQEGYNQFLDTIPDQQLEKFAGEAAQEFDQQQTVGARYMEKRDTLAKALQQQIRQNNPDISDQEVYERMHAELGRLGFQAPQASQQDVSFTPRSMKGGEYDWGAAGAYASGTAAEFPQQVGAVLSGVSGVAGTAAENVVGDDLGLHHASETYHQYYNERVQEALGPNQQTPLHQQVAFDLGRLTTQIGTTVTLGTLSGGAGAAARAGTAGRLGSTALRGVSKTGRGLPLGFMGTREGGAAYNAVKEQLEAKGFRPDQAELRASIAGVGVGAVSSMLEKIPLDEYLQKSPQKIGMFTRAFRGAMAEGSTEAAQEVTNIAAEIATEANRPEFLDAVNQVLYAGGLGSVAGAPTAAITGAARSQQGRDDQQRRAQAWTRAMSEMTAAGQVGQQLGTVGGPGAPAPGGQQGAPAPGAAPAPAPGAAPPAEGESVQVQGAMGRAQRARQAGAQAPQLRTIEDPAAVEPAEPSADTAEAVGGLSQEQLVQAGQLLNVRPGIDQQSLVDEVAARTEGFAQRSGLDSDLALEVVSGEMDQDTAQQVQQQRQAAAEPAQAPSIPQPDTVTEDGQAAIFTGPGRRQEAEDYAAAMRAEEGVHSATVERLPGDEGGWSVNIRTREQAKADRKARKAEKRRLTRGVTRQAPEGGVEPATQSQQSDALQPGDMTPEAGEQIAAELGLQFEGVQEGLPEAGIADRLTFTDPQTGSTLLVAEGESVPQRVAESRQTFREAAQQQQQEQGAAEPGEPSPEQTGQAEPPSAQRRPERPRLARIRDRRQQRRGEAEPAEGQQRQGRTLTKGVTRQPQQQQPGGVFGQLRESMQRLRQGIEQLAGEVDRARRNAVSGLPNRQAFDDTIETVRQWSDQTGQPFAIVALDAKNLKQVNDREGDAEGDQYLEDVGNVLQSVTRSGAEGRMPDAAFHYGGDEYALILPGADQQTANAIRDRAEQRAEQRPIAGDESVRTGIVGAAAVYRPTNPTEPSQLLTEATNEMKARKKEQKAEAGEATTRQQAEGQQQPQGEQPGGEYGQPAPNGTIVAWPTQDIQADPQRFQYKQDVGEEGTRDAMQGEFDPRLAGVIHVWRDPADGQVYVVNGHHRLAQAKRSGTEQVNVMFLEVPNAAEARATGALVNIAEGQGTAVDAAKFMRDRGFTEADLRAENIPIERQFVRQGIYLAQLNDQIFDQVVQGEMTVKRGTIIGQLDSAGQRALMQALARSKRKVSDDVVAELATEVQQAPKAEVTEQTLFGEETSEVNSFIEKAWLIDQLKKDLAKQRRLFKFVSQQQRAEAIQQAGAGQVNVEAAANKAQDAAVAEFYFNQLYRSKGPIADAINNQAEQIVQGRTTRQAALKELRTDVRQAIQRMAQGEEAASAQAGQEGGPTTAEGQQQTGQQGGQGTAGDVAPSKGDGLEITWTSDETTTEVEAPVAPKRTIRNMAPPELVRFAKELLAGKSPRVKKLKKARGRFRYGPGGAQVEIDPDTAASAEQLAKTLAHEIGHLADYLPDETLKRGNLIGRLIKSANSYLSNTFGDLWSDQTTVYDNKEFRRELMDLSAKWRGDFLREGGGKYDQYRRESKELYADFVSVFLNNPRMARQEAPKFFNAFMENFNQSPAFVDSYMQLQALMEGQSGELFEARRADARESYATGREKMLNEMEERNTAKRTSLGGFLDTMKRLVLARGATLESKQKALEKRGVTVPDNANARFILDELNYANNEVDRYLEQVEDLHQQARKAGLDIDDHLGWYLENNRILAGGRARINYDEDGNYVSTDEIANPRGITMADAEANLEHLRNRLSEKQWNELQRIVQKFYDANWQVIERAHEAGLISDDKLAELEQNKDNYATFQVLQYLRDRVPASIKKQVGTFDEIANPWETTNLKMVSMIRLANLNKAKKDLMRNFMAKNFPNEITEKKIPYGSNQVKEPSQPGMEYIYFQEDGKMRAVEVEYAIAESFKYSDIGELKRMADLVQTPTYGFFHQLYVTYNDAFFARNLFFRDPARTFVNVGAIVSAEQREKGQKTTGISWNLLVNHLKAIPKARRRAWGLPDDTIQEMEQHRAIGTPFIKKEAQMETTDVQDRSRMEQMMRQHQRAEENEQGKRHPAKKVIDRIRYILQFGEDLNIFGETVSKVAAWDTMKMYGMNPREAAHTVRNYAGTPNFKKRGTATYLTNSIWLYSNVRWQGFAADASLATSPRTAGGWWWRQMVMTFMPKVAALAGMYGMFGDDMEEMMKAIPEWAHSNYNVFPFGWTGEPGNEKVMFTAIPTDDTGRFMGNLLWKMMQGNQKGWEETAKDLFATARGQIGVTDFNPVINSGWTWMEYASGKNPYDEFREKKILPRDVYEAGGWHAFKHMLSWQINELGVLTAFTSPFLGEGSQGLTEPVTTAERLAGSIPFARGLFRVSGYGQKERRWWSIAQKQREKARMKLSLNKTVRDMTDRRWSLQRVHSQATLKPEERKAYAVLEKWYQKVYLPLTKKMNAARKRGDQSSVDHWRRILEDSTEKWRKELTNE